MPDGIIATPVTKSNLRCHAGSTHISFDWSTNTSLDPEKYLTFSVYPAAEGTLLFTPLDTLRIVASDNAGVMKLAFRYQVDSTFNDLGDVADFSPGTDYGAGKLDTLSFGFQQDVVADSITFRLYGFNAAGESQMLFITNIDVTFQLNIPVSIEHGDTYTERPPNLAFYPNPFSDQAMLPLVLTKPTQVNLTIYDMLGREIETLIDTQLPAGNHRIHWQAAGLRSGLYFFRIQMDDELRTGSLTLVR